MRRPTSCETLHIKKGFLNHEKRQILFRRKTDVLAARACHCHGPGVPFSGVVFLCPYCRINHILVNGALMWLSMADYARKHGKSRQRVHVRINNGEIPVRRMGYREVLIDSEFPWPPARKPGRPRKPKE
jgi:hypothetical protein